MIKNLTESRITVLYTNCLNYDLKPMVTGKKNTRFKGKHLYPSRV